MDLSSIDGLTPEQVEAITAAHQKEVEGLKTNRDALKGEKASIAEKAAQDAQAMEAARQALVEKEQELLKSQNDFEGYKKSVQEEAAKREAILKEQNEKLINANLERDKTNVMAELMPMIADTFQYQGKLMLSNAIDISYNEESKANTLFKHNGEVVADSIDGFKSWAAENPEYKAVLKGVQSSGAGAEQPNGGGNGAPANYADMNPEQKRDFLSKQNFKR